LNLNGIRITKQFKDELENIEKEFFDLFEEKNGFWGQYGIGYKRESWTSYDN
jgi:hypothetical protein